jgi:hypothetical protein
MSNRTRLLPRVDRRGPAVGIQPWGSNPEEEPLHERLTPLISPSLQTAVGRTAGRKTRSHHSVPTTPFGTNAPTPSPAPRSLGLPDHDGPPITVIVRRCTLHAPVPVYFRPQSTCGLSLLAASVCFWPSRSSQLALVSGRVCRLPVRRLPFGRSACALYRITRYALGQYRTCGGSATGMPNPLIWEGAHDRASRALEPES